MGLSPPLLIGNLARLGPTSGSRSPYHVWPKMTQQFGRSTFVNWWCCCRGENDEMMRENQHDENISPNSHYVHFLSACSVCLLDILQLLKLTSFCVNILITKSKSKYLHIFLFKQFLSILKEGSSSLQEVDQNASVPPNLKKDMTTTKLSLPAHQPCGRPQHHLRSQASCSFRLLSLLT